MKPIRILVALVAGLARFYQIENKMDAVIRYELAATIPVIDEKPR